MDYNKLKEEITRQYQEIKIFFEKEGESIDYTEGGFYQSLRNDSMKISMIEKISEKLKRPMAYWWEEGNSTGVNDRGDQTGKEMLLSKIETLEKHVNELKEEKKQFLKEREEIARERKDIAHERKEMAKERNEYLKKIPDSQAPNIKERKAI